MKVKELIDEMAMPKWHVTMRIEGEPIWHNVVPAHILRDVFFANQEDARKAIELFDFNAQDLLTLIRRNKRGIEEFMSGNKDAVLGQERHLWGAVARTEEAAMQAITDLESSMG